MFNLTKAFLFKVRKDAASKTALIFAVALAVFFWGLFLLIYSKSEPKICTGQTILALVSTPTQGYGLVLPAIIATMVVGEFSTGVIRNKVIAGNSKFKIFTSLFVLNAIYSIVLYGICMVVGLLLGTIVGGFNPNGIGVVGLMTFMMGTFAGELLGRLVIMGFFIIVMISAFATSLATIFRSVGPCIPIVIISVFLLTILSITMPYSKGGYYLDGLTKFNPAFAGCFVEREPFEGDWYMVMYSNLFISDERFNWSLISSSVYTVIFYVVGLIPFLKRDLK